MATAPSVRSSAFAVITGTPANPTDAFAASGDTPQGDLLVAMWISSAPGTTPTVGPTAKDGSGTTVATFSSSPDATAADGTRVVYIWAAKITTAPASAVTVTMPTGVSTSGTRRILCYSLNPGSGQRWSTSPLSRRVQFTGTGLSGSWSTVTASNNPEFPIAGIYIATAQTNLGLDWGDGNGSVLHSYPVPGSSYSAMGWAISNGNATGYSTNTLASTSSITLSGGSASNKALAAALYVVQDPSEARGRTAAKAGARFTLVRKASGRGNAAAGSTGRGYKYVTTKTASGRGNAAAKAGATPHPKTANAVAFVAADGWSEGLLIESSHGRGNAAAKAGARFTLVHVSSARGRAAGYGTGAGRKIVPIKSSGRGNAAAVAAAHGKYPYHPAFVSDFLGTLILEDGTSGTIVENTGIAITHLVDDGHTTTTESE